MKAQSADTGQGVQIGVDFGPGTTVIAVAVPGRDCSTLAIPGISREVPGSPPVHVIPSLVRYNGGAAAEIGDEVVRGGKGSDPATARWIRRCLCDRSPVQVPAGNGRMVRYEEAATDLLTRVLAAALEQHPGSGLVMALPAGSAAGYADLLGRTARACGAASVSWIGEEQAAAAGCGHVPVQGEPFLLVSLSPAGTEVSVLVPEEDGAAGPGGMRVLGRAAAATGTHAIDVWIVQDMYSRFRLLESDPRAVHLAPRLRYEATRLRERLPVTKEEAICLTGEVPGRTFETVYATADLERILVAHGVPGAVTDCIDRAFSAMRLKGADTRDVRNVLLTGEGCALPAVQDAVRRHLPSCTVYAAHPADAVARGAALSAAPERAKDRIARSYALRYWDAGQQEHHYRFLVHPGTRFPSAGQVARVVISAAYDGQTHLGIPLYEMGGGDGGRGPEIELISDAGGGVRLAGPEKDAAGGQEAIHANERTPTLLVANPPARKGEPRFECTFTIDPERNLRLSARDLLTGAIVKLDWPVHRLT